MLPTQMMNAEIEVEAFPSLDYKFDFEREYTIQGTTDGPEAVKQAIFNILSTERYKYIIYSWDYGIETKDLYGEPIDYVIAEIGRRIEEALLQDDRIISIVDMEVVAVNKHDISCKFIVNTIYGGLAIEREVLINV